jgi:5,10-methylenetetrahydromethanopterin reductase
MGGVEFWTTGVGFPGFSARAAERAEAAGWDGLFLVDSQNLAGDVFVAMALAARATDRLLLGTGVTNPVTRHPAVTASAVASVQAESGGRAALGIGRGDSSLAHLGLAPAPVPVFERYLERLQAYLRGEEVEFPSGAEGESGGPGGAAPAVGRLGLASAPAASRLRWLPGALPKVPVLVAATGPRVIDVGARLADRVTFAVGAQPERVAWAVETARAARKDAGLDPDGISFGAYVNVLVHPDPAVALELASGGLATFARFQVMHGNVQGPADESQREVLERLHDAYDMTVHTMAGSPQAQQLTPEFARRFAIFGPADECVSRLRELVSLGLDHFAVVGGSIGADRQEIAKAAERFTNEVLPALR